MIAAITDVATSGLLPSIGRFVSEARRQGMSLDMLLDAVRAAWTMEGDH